MDENQGSSVKSGHYVGWIKQKGKWYKCDDEKVSSVTKQSVQRLKGGSEAHSAYICLYKFIDSNAKFSVCFNSQFNKEYNHTE